MLTTASTLSGLEEYVPNSSKPWNADRVHHLHRRFGFGATPAQIEAGLALSPGDLVDQLVDGVLNLPPLDPPVWANWSSADYDLVDDAVYFDHKRELVKRWINDLIAEGARAKLALFWHNHFVTQELVYSCNSFMWAYYELLHRQCLGNFRQFVEEMGQNPAMLVYLNGNRNIASEPNENYARELMELFTMGEGNGYTQADIPEVARALTGWRVNMYTCVNQVTFASQYHDYGQKTIFGQTGNWGYYEVHNLIFNQRRDEVARYICAKIYRNFVYDRPDWAIIDEMAETFKNSGWNLAAVFRQLLKSEHFFEQHIMNAHLKSPLESILQPFRMVGLNLGDDYNDDTLGYLAYVSGQLGQELFNPVDVAGWPGYRDWINENTLAFRWSFMGNILNWYFLGSDSSKEKLRQLAIGLVGDQELDPAVYTAAIANHILGRTLEDNFLETATQYFKGEIPENYFENGTWNIYYDEAPYQVADLLYYLMRLPEWQLG